MGDDELLYKLTQAVARVRERMKTDPEFAEEIRLKKLRADAKRMDYIRRLREGERAAMYRMRNERYGPNTLI